MRYETAESFANSERLFYRIATSLGSGEIGGDLDSVEDWIRFKIRELGMRLLQAHLDQLGCGDMGAAIDGADGIRRTHKRLRPRTIYSIFGPITLTRYGYSKRGTESVFPLDAALNLPAGKYSHSIRRKLAYEISRSSFSETRKMVLDEFGFQISSQALCQLVLGVCRDFDDYFSASRSVRSAKSRSRGTLIVMSTDGKGVVMRHDALRDQTKKAAKDSEAGQKKRLSKGEKPNRKRMAQVAVVYNIQKHQRSKEDILDEYRRTAAKANRPRPTDKRVWASLVQNTNEVIRDMVAEAKSRSPKGKKNFVALIDGNNHQFECLVDCLDSAQVEATIILDIIHVLEYVWIAANALLGEQSHERAGWVEDKLDKLLDGRADAVCRGLKISSGKLGLKGTKKQTIEKVYNYLWSNSELMRYDEYLEAGFPIATGVIEGACRHLVKDRMEITGARWGLEGAEAVLKLRSIAKSGEWDDYWDFHLDKERTRNYTSVYKGP